MNIIENKKISNLNKRDSKFFTFVSSVSNTYWFMLKNHFKSSSFYLGNLLIPILLVFSLSILFPITYSFIWMLFLSLSFASFSAYGTLFFTIRKSTMMKNVDMTTNESMSLYFATFMIILTVSAISFIILMLSLITLYETGIASDQFFFNQSDENIKTIEWFSIWWGMIVYYWFVQAFLAFSMSFCIEQLVSTQKNYFIIVFIYILGSFFFGGVMSPTISVDDNGIIKIYTQADIEAMDPFQSQGIIPALQKGGFLWYVSQFWPHYGLNQVAFQSLEAASTNILNTPSPWADINILNMTKTPGVLYYILMPWAYVFIGIWLGGILDKFKENKKRV